MGRSVSNSLTLPFADLTGVTLADEDTNSILTENANRTIQGNVTMQVTQPGVQICNQFKWWHNRPRQLSLKLDLSKMDTTSIWSKI